MFYVEQKLKARLHELASYRYRECKSFEFLMTKEDLSGEVNPQIPEVTSDWNTMKVGEAWSGRDRYLWLHKKVEIPKEWEDKPIVGIFDFGKTGGGNNSGFESLLYINDQPFQGVDSNHKEVFLPKEFVGSNIEMTFRLWSGLEGGGEIKEQEHKIFRADVAWLDEVVDDLFYITRVILETIEVLDKFSPEKNILLKAVDEGYKLIDWSTPGSDEFYKSLYDADRYINDAIESIDKQSLVNVKCIGHTHIDVAWLWRLKHTREKCARSFSTVIRLMEKYPEYIFLQTQPQLYEYIKNDYPEIYERIKEKVREGKWEVDGGMWVEADCNVTSGESLTRQILIGSQFIKKEFDKDVEYLWLPDVFGYSWALPQILKKSGIDLFMTTKISWNQYNRMPHDTFKWKGIDGSEVIAHFITTPEPWADSDSWFYTYNGELTPKTVKGVWDNYRDKELTDELLISYGYGDGGGGVNRDMLELRRRIDKTPGLPSLKTEKAADYFNNLKEKVENTNRYVHTWDGELYLEYHRGTYTSQGYNKKMNRKLELLYRQVEWLGVMDAVLNGNMERFKQEVLTEGWKIILRNQFHDIIPGSSINEVYKDSRIEYEEAEEIALKVEKEALPNIIDDEEGYYTIINNSNWNRTEVVEIILEEDGIWYSENGDILNAQKINNLWNIQVENVPAMGLKTIRFENKQPKEEESAFKLDKSHIETPYYSIDLNDAGQFISIFDKEESREILRDGEKANVLQMFEDKPLAHDAWDIDIFYQEKMKEVTDLVSVEIKAVGSLKAILHLEYCYNKSTIKQDVIFYNNDKRIDFKTWVNWKERHTLLKVAFPVDIRATSATYDVQYGNVKRPTHWNTSWDIARFESVAHQWVDLSEHNYGISLLNDCKYGHDIKDNVIRLSLLKSATYPDTEQDQGEHEFTYALLPHKGGFVEGNTVQSAWALNQPLKVAKGMSKYSEESFITIDNPYVTIDAIKKSEDGNYLVVRFHEFTGSKQNVNIKTLFDIKGYMLGDLMERPIEDFKETETIEVNVKPYEIITVLIKI